MNLEDAKIYSIKELSKILDISDHTVRKYEKDFNLKIPRNELGHRYYTDGELEVFKRILDWKAKGFNKETINKLLGRSVEAMEQKESAAELVTVDKLTGAELKDLMAKEIGDILSEREERLQEQYEEKLNVMKEDLESKMEEELENQSEKIREQIACENEKLMDYIDKSRKNKGFWSRLFNK